MELVNEIKPQKNNFLGNIIGKTINNAVDMGLKVILPDLVENQVIDIKNALIENGLKAGIDEAIESVVQLGKSAAGIFTGNFENMSQVRVAVGEGGIVDTVSKILDKTIDQSTRKGIINNSVGRLIKNGKNIILESVENNIKNEIDIQDNMLRKLDKNLKQWKECYENKNFEGMEKEYNEINSIKDQIIPIDNILNETKRISGIHNLIKSNGHKFEISDIEKQLAEKL